MTGMASLLEMSLGGGCIILTAALLRAAAKDRLPVGMFEALWTLAWARLMVPVRLPFRLSAWVLLRRAAPHTAVPTPTAAVVLPGRAAAQAVDIIHGITQPDIGRPFPTVTVLWLAGAALCAGALLAGYIRARRRLRDGSPADCDYVNQFLAEHPLRRQVSVRVSDRIAAPLTYGVLRPVILLPRSTDLTDSGTLGYVLAHELAHIRRFDAVRKPALAAAVCLHWFDPAAWLMAVLAGRDMERACDRAVVRAFGSAARRGYALALLTLEERRGGFLPGSGFAKNAIEERIHSIMKIKPVSFLSALLALALVLSVGAVFATAAPEAAAGGAGDITASVPGSSGDVLASPDGTVTVYNGEGEPVTMTWEEFEQFIDPVQVEWWTAEEYAAWLEQEKKDLQDCLGQRAWTQSDGWFTWTQEKIDETIEMYEQVLWQIENGRLVSKTVDGGSDAVLMQGSQDILFLTEDPAADTYSVRVSGPGEFPAEAVQPVRESDGTVTVPANESFAAFFQQADGAPYGQIDGGGRVRLADGVAAAAGNTVSVGVTARTDAALTVSLHGDSTAMGQSVDLKAGQTQTVTFRPEQDGAFAIYLTNNSEYPVEFIASWAVS